MATPASFWKKYRPVIPNKPKSAPNSDFLGCIWSWCISRRLVSSQIRQFCLFTYPFIQKWVSSLKICLAKFGLTSNWSRTQGEHMALSMVIYLKFLGQLNFIGVQTQVPTQNSPNWSRRKSKFLWMRNWPPRVFPYTLAQQRCFQQILRFGDVMMLADYLSNRLTRIWLPNIE